MISKSPSEPSEMIYQPQAQLENKHGHFIISLAGTLLRSNRHFENLLFMISEKYHQQSTTRLIYYYVTANKG